MEIKEVAARILLGDMPERSLQAMAKRIRQGKAPHLEKFFAEHLWGKPKETLDINLTQVQLIAMLGLSDMHLLEFVRLMDAKQPEQALQLLPGGAA